MSQWNDFLHQHTRNAVGRDVFDLVFGEYLGRGQFREVFAYEPDPNWVVKVEDNRCSFSNVREHDIWCSVRDTALAKWFAPIHKISASGILLVQARTKPPRLEELPRQVPAFFTDLKASNWGWYDGRIVCHDYGNHLMLEKGMTARMRKADWSE